MAHHARRSIYPCRRCDLEFSRHSDLRAHLRDDHRGNAADGESEEKKPGHSCPECDFHAPTRSVLYFACLFFGAVGLVPGMAAILCQLAT